MAEGTIYKALSGFYYVESDDGKLYSCRARGKFRLERATPLVGDRVRISADDSGNGTLLEILPRKNSFVRPPLANLDMMVIVAAAVIPVTDPFLIDRMIVVSEHSGCEPVICINKADMNSGDELFGIYKNAGFKTLRVSAATGEGMDELREVLRGHTSALTGNSGVGKSSILNRLEPDFAIPVGDVSEKLGRGRHTTRHVELLRMSFGAIIADTPGFSSFDTEMMDKIPAPEMKRMFREFEPYNDNCRFADCAHVKEAGCCVLEAVKSGGICKSRHDSYVRLYETAKARKDWE